MARAANLCELGRMRLLRVARAGKYRPRHISSTMKPMKAT